jgi:hypothetical protein
MALSRPVISKPDDKTMKNRNIIAGSLLALALSCATLTQAQNQGNVQPVNVVNTPSVNVANTPNVKVVNTTANPVPVVGTVNTTPDPAHSAVQMQLTVVGNAGGFPSSVTVPAGKILVIEYVSFAFSFTSPGTSTLNFLAINVFDPPITGGSTPVAVDHYLVMPPPNSVGVIQGAQALRLYAQPGTIVSFTVGTSSTDTGRPTLLVSISGYFVNATQ